MTLPGTTVLISLPPPAEVSTVRFSLMRPARSRIPCKPKCPSLPSSTMAVAMPNRLILNQRGDSFVEHGVVINGQNPDRSSLEVHVHAHFMIAPMFVARSRRHKQQK